MTLQWDEEGRTVQSNAVGGSDTEKVWQWKRGIAVPPITWSYSFEPEFSIAFNLTGTPPSRFHRFMMRWCLGIYTRIGE